MGSLRCAGILDMKLSCVDIFCMLCFCCSHESCGDASEASLCFLEYFSYLSFFDCCVYFHELWSGHIGTSEDAVIYRSILPLEDWFRRTYSRYTPFPFLIWS